MRVAWARDDLARSPLYWQDEVEETRIDPKKTAEELISKLSARKVRRQIAEEASPP